MAELQIGLGFVVGLSTAAGTVMTVDYTGDPYSGSILPLYTAQRTTHSLESKRVKNMFGKTVGIIIDDEEVIECTFDFIPSGSTRANAATSAKFPGAAIVTLANLPVVAVGAFTDAYNSGAWLYLGGGTINGDLANAWTATLPLIRFSGIPSPALVSG